MTSARLGEFITLRRGASYKSAKLGEEGIPLLGLGTIAKHGGFKPSGVRLYGGDAPDRMLVHDGDLYVSLKDMTQEAALLGAVARVPGDMPVGRLTQDTIALDVSEAAPIRKGYLYWVLRDPRFRKYCRNLGTGTTNLDLSQKDFLAYETAVPGKSMQRNVENFLGALDDKIAANARAIDHGRKLLRAVWERCADGSSRQVRLGDVVEVNPRVVKSDLAEPPYVDMKALPEHGLLLAGAGRREAKGGARFLYGDTLMARITPCFENGKMAYVDVLGAGEVGYGSTEFIVFRSLGGVPSAVPYMVVSSVEFRMFAARSMIGTSGRQRVQSKGLDEYELDWPDEEKLAEFGVFSDALLGRLGAARDESQRLAATRDELLPLLMSGKITVKDAEKTVEEVL